MNAPNQNTRRIMIGNVPIGAGAPVAVQSMLNAPATSIKDNLAQIDSLAQAGCEVIRMAIPTMECMPVFEAVCKESPLPVVADVHFSTEIAICAAKSGAAKLRINPGNIGGLKASIAVMEAAKQANIPVRIGVNAGSLDKNIANKTNLSLPEKLAQSATEYVNYYEERGFTQLVVSAKAHSVPSTVESYKLLSKNIPKIPLHIGITEAGTALQGTIKSAAGLGILLHSGIGDTLRVSLTDNPVREVDVCWSLLSALELRQRNPELVSCPTCGRCQVNLISLAKQVEEKLSAINKPISVAVMGCVVNGPGEAKDADIGVACGQECGVLFARGEILYKVPEDKIVESLMKEIEKL